MKTIDDYTLLHNNSSATENPTANMNIQHGNNSNDFVNDANATCTGESDKNSLDEEDMHHNSKWSTCVINLFSTAVGAGMLGMPYAFSKSGWIL